MFGEGTDREWSTALDAVAEELLWEAGVGEPPVDAFYVALELGLTVTCDELFPGRAQMVRHAGDCALQRQTTIVLGDEDRFERRQFAVAHELGEFAAVRVFERLAIDPRLAPLGSREHVANALAARLLLPRRWFHKRGIECEWDLPTLKDAFWTVSHELIARRMLDMPPQIVVTVLDHGEVTWRRSNFGASPGSMLEVEYQTWRECHALGMLAECESAEDTYHLAVRCWPVHEPGWCREILRTDVTGHA